MPTLSDTRRRALIAAIAELAWTIPPDGFVTDIPEWRAYTGQSVAEVAGWGWLDAVHPEDRAATAEAWQTAVRDRARYSAEYRLRRRDGVYCWSNARAAPVLDADGTLIEWVGVQIDVDERYRAKAEAAAREADFRMMADSITQLAWMADPDGSIFWYNQRWYAFTGTTLADMQGWGWRSVHHPDHVERVEAHYRAAIAANSPWEDTFPLRSSDGRYRWFLSHAEPIRDGTGRVLRWFGTNTDITAQRESELAVREANDEVQRFAYVVSHDLRAPLVNIMGFSSELSDLQTDLQAVCASHPQAARIDADFTEALAFIRAAVNKMDGLIGAILRLAREGRRTLRPEVLDMRALLEGLVAAQQHQAVAAGARVTVAPDVPAIIADRLAVEQIFGNLIDNAIKYLDPQRLGRIAITGRVTGRTVVYEVTDNGRGISAADRERVFDLFRRAGRQDKPGEGIGLAHVRTLVRAIGGTITLHSEPNVGTRFELRIPLLEVSTNSPSETK